MGVKGLRDVEEGCEVMYVVPSTVLVGAWLAVAVDVCAAAFKSENACEVEQCDARGEEAAFSC